MWSNLSKTFRFVNDEQNEIVFDVEHGYLINKPRGIDTLSIMYAQAQGINQIGATAQSFSVQPRPITIDGVLCGDFQENHKRDLLSAVRPDIGGRLYADGMYVDCKVTATPTIGPEMRNAKFQFALIAHYPYWISEREAHSSLVGYTPAFKFPLNLSRPYRFGNVVKNAFIEAENKGQVPSTFTITLTALDAVSGIKITEVESGAFLEIKKPLEAGERMIIETTHERTNVISSAIGSCRGALSLKSNLFRLPVGAFRLKPESSDMEKLQVDIAYSEETAGIYV